MQVMDDRLYRSRTDRVFTGVAAGVADRLDMDPSIVRIIWAVLVLPTGFVALLIYVVMAFVVPEEPIEAMGPTVAPSLAADGTAVDAAAMSGDATAGATPAAGVLPLDWRAQRRADRIARRAARRADGGNGALVFGAILIAVGTIFFVRQYLPDIDFDVFWPSALIVLGLILVAASFRRNVRG
jgi:phage shock protein PspC (stress-responsive transcriptional regulator)